MNKARTCTGADTTLTQPRSGFDLDQTRRCLIMLRLKHGANSPIGHRCSNLIEQLKNLPGADPDQRKHLEKSIAKSVKDLAALTVDAEHHHPQGE